MFKFLVCEILNRRFKLPFSNVRWYMFKNQEKRRIVALVQGLRMTIIQISYFYSLNIDMYSASLYNYHFLGFYWPNCAIRAKRIHGLGLNVSVVGVLAFWFLTIVSRLYIKIDQYEISLTNHIKIVVYRLWQLGKRQW